LRRLTLHAALIGALLVVFGTGSYALADGGSSSSNTRMIGYEEVPSVSTAASGEFRAKISGDQIDWTLTYRDLEGDVQQGHIHFGQKGVNGGISVFLCTNLGNGPVGTQPCPPDPATISGTIQAADVSPNIPATAAARTQGIDTGEFAELVAAIREGVTYANVHSTRWPGGEVRAQLADGGDD
jgi:CHRD domain